MRWIRIYGASDDLLEVEGDAQGCDEFNIGCDNEGCLEVLASGRPMLEIRPIYNGCWSFAVAPSDEEVLDPLGWVTSRVWGGSCAYSETIILQTPDDVSVQWKDLA